MAVRLTIKDTGIKQFITRTSFTMSAGIHPEDGAAQHPANNGGRPFTMADLGAIHEHGTGTIPARSWLRGWFDEQGTAVLAQIRASLKPVALKQLWTAPAPAALKDAARKARNAIVSRIGQKLSPPLAESTLAKKAPKIVPLIDSRAFVDTVSVQIESGSTVGDSRGKRMNWDYAARAGGGGSK